MICIRCGHANHDSNNYCEKCNAHLPKMAGQGAPGGDSILSVEEGYTYITPQKHYQTEYIVNLTDRASEYLNEGASGEPLLEAYNIVKARWEELEQNQLPDMFEGLKSLSSQQPEDTYPKQMKYLLHKGANIFREGIEQFESFIQTGSTDTLTEACHKLVEGNDYFCLAAEFNAQMEAITRPMLEAIERSLAAGGGPAAATPASDSSKYTAHRSSSNLDKTQPI
jgi:hypothetical protein